MPGNAKFLVEDHPLFINVREDYVWKSIMIASQFSVRNNALNSKLNAIAPATTNVFDMMKLIIIAYIWIALIFIGQVNAIRCRENAFIRLPYASKKIVSAWVYIKTVFLFWERKNVSYKEITAPHPVMTNACLKMSNAQKTVKLSTQSVSLSLDNLNAWRPETHVKINVGAVLASNAKISAPTNTITASLLSRKKKPTVSKKEMNAQIHVILNAHLKTYFAWITAPKSSIVAVVS